MNDEHEPNPKNNKRRRLNYACDRCRTKKIRCDDCYPECGNCHKAGVTCITRDPRNPQMTVIRHEAQLPPYNYHANDTSHAPPDEVTPMSTTSVASSVRLNTVTEEVEDAIQLPGQGRAEPRLPVFPRFMNGNSLYILTQWLDLAFARLNHSSRFSHLYREKTVQTALPPLRDEHVDEILNVHEQRCTVLESFLSTVYHVFRLERIQYWEAILEQPRPVCPVHAILRALILALTDHPDACRFLDLAFSRTSIIIQCSDIDSLLALFLMVIAFRGSHDSHTAVHLLSIANSIAHGLSLHSASPNGNPTHIDIWWSVYAIDKALAVELERKPMIPSSGCDQKDPMKNEMLAAIVQLARIQESIVDRVVKEREMEDSHDRTLNEIIIWKMRSAGELDGMLQQWERSLPCHMRITDHPCSDEKGLLSAAYLGLQYYQTLFAIHRNSLITNANHIKNLADEAFANQHYRLRLRNGSLICYTTAKAIITLTAQVFDQATGLAIYIYKHPNTSVVHSDLQLLSTVITFIEKRASGSREMSPDRDLGKLLRALHSDLSTRVTRMEEGGVAATSSVRRPYPNRNTYSATGDVQVSDDDGDENGTSIIVRPILGADVDYTDPANFDMSLFTDDVTHWPDFLELLDLSSPFATFSRNSS